MKINDIFLLAQTDKRVYLPYLSAGLGGGAECMRAASVAVLGCSSLDRLALLHPYRRRHCHKHWGRKSSTS